MTDQPPNPSPDSASLVKRLAGPSVTKAGLAKDQTEINRIIAEVSKGSKFYENEKRKDKDLTERIAKILKERDELLKAADIGRIEADVDRLLVDLEAQRDLSQFIVHVDMDAFYASVELMDNPDLEGKAFGVGKGVLTTASYEARRYGVRSGMAGFVAKALCPDLIFLPIDMPKYVAMSKKVMAIFEQYDPNMLVAGCDEGYLNITHYCQEHDMSPEDCVQQMRAQVKEETNLTASAGIAPNKMLAKICSDKNKPNGQFHLPFERKAVVSFMNELPIRKLPGVGRVNERLLDSIGVKTCGDILAHRATISLMDKHFGLDYLLRAYLGITSNIVQPHSREERKSIGAERTFNPIHNQQEILQKLEEVAEELEKDMERHGWAGKTVTLKYKLNTYEVFTRAKSFERWITKKDDLFKTGKELIKNEFPLSLRLIGLRVTKLKDLRAPETHSIKRFFEAGGPSPSKKRKISQEEEEVPNDDDDDMPGDHEEEQVEEEIIDVDINVDEGEEEEGPSSLTMGPNNMTNSKPLSRTSIKPLSRASVKPTSRASVKPVSRASVKPVSKITNVQSTPRRKTPHPTNHDTPRQTSIITEDGPVKEMQMCPICLKELETDNSGLNAHVDFCLSKGAIMQATQVAPPSSASRGKKVKMKLEFKSGKRT